ncbi:MAG: NADAR family protein [Flavobacteriaceae bacterium]|nr:NADAR family protein [Flavobacteriaceae bacterium]
MSKSLSTPQPKQITINGTQYSLLAFYYPGYNEAWDNTYQAPFMGNFYPSVFSMTIDTITGTFHNAEAAFQATKWWKNDAARTQFENALTGNEAFHIKKGLSKPDYSYCKLGRDGAMLKVVTEKFALPEFKKGLLASGDAYLLEHNAIKGRDNYWSDDHDGTGTNMLGITLMDVRSILGGEGVPGGNYTVKDFTQYI